MRKFALAGVAALLLGAASLPSTANAALVTATSATAATLNVPGSVPVVGVSLNGSVGDSFEAYLTFDLSSLAPSGGSTQISNNVGADLDFSTFQLFARLGSGTPTGPVLATGGITPNVGGSIVDFANLNFTSLAAGFYVLKLAGTFASAGQGSINGTISAVPVPAAILLLGPALAGLGLMGRRRKDGTAPVAA
jgi:hypothetical protein